jgi:hypothetical protein
MTLNLLNVILPFLFFELKYVLISLIFVVLIETFIVKFFIQQKFGFLFQVLIFANISTTLIGYFLQGVFRIILTILFNIQSNNPIIRGLTGNFGLKKHWTSEDNTSVIISIATSIMIAIFLSIYVERKVLINMYEGKVEEARISKGIKYANIVSYTLLFFWIYLNYRL